MGVGSSLVEAPELVILPTGTHRGQDPLLPHLLSGGRPLEGSPKVDGRTDTGDRSSNWKQVAPCSLIKRVIQQHSEFPLIFITVGYKQNN